ncbi:MAG: aspartate aminotransferase family protein [Nitrososphaerota archaeon]
MKNTRSLELFEKACRLIPGGVNTSIRILDPPIVFTKARGSRIYDADGNEYIDYHAAFGPPILGHNNPEVNRRVMEIMSEVDLIGVGTAEIEIRAAELIVKHVPSIEKVLFCNSGSEATYHAVRLARAVTGRKKLIKFQGCYHGWHDYLLMNVISAPDKIGKKDPLSAGMLPEAVENTIVLDFNDLDGVERTVKMHRGEIAAIILEPIPHNIGCVLPKIDFLRGLREIADREDIVLIFDEVITGFRHHVGGYQKIVNVIPDLTTLGKAMANGYPLAAIGGRADLMDRFNTRPGGDVFFAGTYNAHPFCLAACIATIEQLEDGKVHEYIFRLGEMMRQGLSEMTEELGIKAYTTGFGSVFVTYFMEPPVENYTDLLRNDAKLFVEYRKKMIERGIFMLPLNLKRNHISAAHTEEDVKITLEKSREALVEIIKK